METRTSGRPRDEVVGPTILAVARRLVTQHGYDGVTTQMIAETAGAGKQTIYRRWPSKAELVLDAFLSHTEAEVDGPSARGPIRDQVAAFLRRTFAALAETGPAVRSLMATAQNDETFRTNFRTRFIEPRRRSLASLLSAAVADGQLPASADAEMAAITIYGAVWYRLLLGESMDDATADRIAVVVVNGLAARVDA